MSAFTDELEQMAKQKGIKPTDILEKAGLTAANYYNWRSGAYKPSHTAVQKIYSAMKSDSEETIAPAHREIAEVFSIIYSSPLTRDDKQKVVSFILNLL